MRISRTFNFAVGFALTLALAIAPVAAVRAQAVMSDYEKFEKAAQAQRTAEWRLAFRPNLQVLNQTVQQLRILPRVTPEQKGAADALLAQAATQSEPDARRTLWRAAMTLLGKQLTADQDVVGSAALRSPVPVVTGEGDRAHFEQLYPVEATSKVAYSLDLFGTEPTTSATPVKGSLVRKLGEGQLDQAFPHEVAIDLSGIADGTYLLIGHVSSGAESAELAQPIYLVRDLASRDATLKAELAAIPGHDAAKALAEYPFALAAAIRGGTREIISYDFPKAIARSNAIVADLKQGHDSVQHATGLQSRAYQFEGTGELIPYQIYVPSAWTPDRKWPFVVALHGANLDETNMLGRAGAQLQKLAEQHGFIVLSPLGYRLNSGYGSIRDFGSELAGEDPQRLQRSEQDVLQAMAQVEREYNVDANRRYLTGNSMGGGGTWWLGGRYPERWAAIAPAAYGGVLPEDVPGLSRVPIMAVVGERDELGMLDRVRASVATLKSGGVTVDLIEVPGGSHTSAFDTTLPKIFDFFAAHSK
jgi:poly(3-hydroxybutyrate) depolymerase